MLLEKYLLVVRPQSLARRSDTCKALNGGLAVKYVLQIVGEMRGCLISFIRIFRHSPVNDALQFVGNGLIFPAQGNHCFSRYLPQYTFAGRQRKMAFVV